MEHISSHANQYLKLARQVRDGHVEGTFYVEGKRLAEDFLKSELEAERLFVTERFAENNPSLKDALVARSRYANSVDSDFFDSISSTKSPQGVSLICHKPEYGKDGFERLAESEASLFVLLCDINNPGNLGAVLRSAEAFGVSGVLITKGSANAFSGASVRGSMGSAFRLPIWEQVIFEDTIEWAGEHGYHTSCADIGAEQLIGDVEWQPKTMIVFGSEAHGLSLKKRRFIDSEFRIPMNPLTESLNLASAASIVLFEARR
jgi:TrmH family RNA methyltransferase